MRLTIEGKSIIAKLWQHDEVRLLGLFLVLLIIYLLIASQVHAPMGYYGTIDKPRFADPWIERTETILSGRLLYRDVFTATPPLTNFLIVPPAFIAKLLGYKNPWATLAFMLYFSLFNLLAAYTLLYLGKSRYEGWRAAVMFLLNPLTFSNTVLRRQDESILVFFWGLSLLLFVQRRHWQAALAIGATLLVKLSGVLLIPVAVLHSRYWRYILIPAFVFALAMAPFLFLAGRDAMFWDFSRRNAEHPFQLDGISLGALWELWHGKGSADRYLGALSVLFVVGVGAMVGFVAWKRFGVLEDLTLLTATVLLLIPKLHAGYFSLLALTMAPLLSRYRLEVPYFLLGTLIIVGDFLVFPIRDHPFAFVLMVVASALLLGMIVRLSRPSALESPGELSRVPGT
ncbi:MAG: glycosyltransferase 87 family protein [Anaerolineae bacterium]|nr:glycosyltransferase 87 family protein [Anaerolineae bacterium]MDW8100334.1 glycosyltransferase 87 family protein [Anaerolineae bacterium]